MIKKYFAHIIVIILSISIFAIFYFIGNSQKNKNLQENVKKEISSLKNNENKEEMILNSSKNNEEKNYEIISERSYFYEKADDKNPKKAFVMKGDIVKIDNKKSTEKMVFATFTNSAGKTTQGFLKKSEIKEIEKKSGKEIKSKNSPKCKNSYDFLKIPEPGYGEPNGKVRLNFGWENSDCKQQNKVEMIPEMFDVIENFYKGEKASTINFNIGLITGGGTGGGYNILEEIDLSSKEISVNGINIYLKAIKRIEEEENGQKTSYYVSIDISGVFFYIKTPKNDVYKNFEDISNNLQKYFSIEHLPYKKADHLERERLNKKIEELERKKQEEREKEEEKKRKEELKNLDLTKVDIDSLSIRNYYPEYLKTIHITKTDKSGKKTEFDTGFDSYEMLEYGFEICNGFNGYCEVNKILGPKKFAWATWSSVVRRSPKFPCYLETDLGAKKTKFLGCDQPSDDEYEDYYEITAE